MIAVGALAIRVAYNLVVDPAVAVLSDASAYHQLGRNLADGRGYIRPFDFQLFGVHRATAEYPPLFPALLAFLTLIGLGSVNNQQLVLTVVGTATVVLTGLIGRRVAGDTAGLVAAGIAAIHPMLFQADGILMTESLSTALVAGCVLLALRVRSRPGVGGFVALGALLGITTLCRAEGFLLAPLLIVPLAFVPRGRPFAQRITLAAAGLVAVVGVLTPWTVYNETRFHTFIPVSNNLGTVLDGANCGPTYSGPALGSWRFIRAGDCFAGFDIRDPHFDEATAAAAARRQGIDYFRAHKRRAPAVAAARLARTWGVFRPSQQVNLGVLEGRNHRWETAGTWLTWLLLPLAVAGAVLLARRRATLWPLLAPIVTVSIVSIVTYGNPRFRASADPMLCVLAAVTVASIAAAASTMRATSAGARNLTPP
ncbi:MAG: hypothetical protein JWL83_4284 [Actinomycetia bacterium]|nr:hypothetical protein [Actinomycetes bacterium]